MIRFETTFTTSGDGYWSSARKTVNTIGLEVPYINDERNFGELRVHFDPRSWDINEDGLIYTDTRFLKELRAKLNDIGFPGDDIEYSEQGMQGDEFVSLDVGPEFLAFWMAVTEGIEV